MLVRATGSKLRLQTRLVPNPPWWGQAEEMRRRKLVTGCTWHFSSQLKSVIIQTASVPRFDGKKSQQISSRQRRKMDRSCSSCSWSFIRSIHSSTHPFNLCLNLPNWEKSSRNSEVTATNHKISNKLSLSQTLECVLGCEIPETEKYRDFS